MRKDAVGDTIGLLFDDQEPRGSMWPTSFALLSWDATNEKQLRALVKSAVG